MTFWQIKGFKNYVDVFPEGDLAVHKIGDHVPPFQCQCDPLESNEGPRIARIHVPFDGTHSREDLQEEIDHQTKKLFNNLWPNFPF